jgi:hypothetical protein
MRLLDPQEWLGSAARILESPETILIESLCTAMYKWRSGRNGWQLEKKVLCQDGDFKASKDVFRNTQVPKAAPLWRAEKYEVNKESSVGQHSVEILSDHPIVNHLWVPVRLERMINDTRRLIQKNHSTPKLASYDRGLSWSSYSRGQCGNSIGSHRQSSSVPAILYQRFRPRADHVRATGLLPFR